MNLVKVFSDTQKLSAKSKSHNNPPVLLWLKDSTEGMPTKGTGIKYFFFFYILNRINFVAKIKSEYKIKKIPKRIIRFL